jgi:hypothetical protein
VSTLTTTTAKIAISALLKRLPTPQRALDAMAEQLWEQVVEEAVQAIQRLEVRVGKDFAALQAQIDQTDSAILSLRLLDQATRSAGAERRRMMTNAVAGVFEPDLEIEMKSRAERALEQLEPSDVIALRAVIAVPFEKRKLLRVNADALVSAGCVSLAERIGSTHARRGTQTEVNADEATPLGRAVVQLVTTWPGDVAE